MSDSTKTTNIQKQLYPGLKGEARKFAYASGEIVYNLPWMLVSSYLAFFMTDIAAIPAATVSMLFLVCRVWDAVNDPLIGSLADNTKSRLGRYRIWMLICGCVFLPLVMLNFQAHPDWDETSRTIYAVIMYFVVVIFSTGWNIPFSALGSVISPYPRERASFASRRIFVSSLASAVASALFLGLIAVFSGADGSDVVGGYGTAAVVVCAIAIPFIFTSVFGTKEAIQAPPKQKFTAKQMAQSFTKNRPLMIIVVAFFVYGFLQYGRMTVGMYYFTYVWGSQETFALYASVNGIICAIAALFCAGLVKICKGKRGAMLVTYGAATIINIILFFITPESGGNITTVLILLYICAITTGINTGLLYGIIGDACDYGQWKTHLRADGLCSSGTSFALKLGGAISPTLLLAMLASTGYVANAETQTAGALSSMNIVMNLIPAILAAISFVLFIFYNLSEQKHAEILTDLRERGELVIDDD